MDKWSISKAMAEWKRNGNMPNVTEQLAFGCAVFQLSYFFFYSLAWFCLKCLQKRKNNKKNTAIYITWEFKNCGITTPESKKRLHIRTAAPAGRFANTFTRRRFPAKSCLHATPCPLTLATQYEWLFKCVCTMNSQWKNKTVYWLTAAVTATATAHNCNILFSSSFFEPSFGGMLFVCDDKWFVRMCVLCMFFLCVSLFDSFWTLPKKTSTMWRQRRQHKHSHI